MEIAFDVLGFDELGKGLFELGGFDFTRVGTHFRRDVLQAEGFVAFGFGLAGQFFPLLFL